MKTNAGTLSPEERALYELYATFGFAFYLGECLAEELCVAHACSGVRSRIEFPERFDAARKLPSDKTLNALGEQLPSGLYEDLRRALDTRRQLRDEFWQNRLQNREDPRRVDVMLSELSARVQALMDVRGELAAWVRPVLTKYQISLPVVDPIQN